MHWILGCVTAEPPRAVPLLGFGKQRLDPYLALAHRFLTRRGGVVALDPLQGGLVEVAADMASVVAGGALSLEPTGVASRSRGDG